MWTYFEYQIYDLFPLGQISWLLYVNLLSVTPFIGQYKLLPTIHKKFHVGEGIIHNSNITLPKGGWSNQKSKTRNLHEIT